jgi:hypothetical protein
VPLLTLSAPRTDSLSGGGPVQAWRQRRKEARREGARPRPCGLRLPRRQPRAKQRGRRGRRLPRRRPRARGLLETRRRRHWRSLFFSVGLCSFLYCYFLSNTILPYVADTVLLEFKSIHTQDGGKHWWTGCMWIYVFDAIYVKVWKNMLNCCPFLNRNKGNHKEVKLVRAKSQG